MGWYFYDNIWGDITWASANIDINNEGQSSSS